MVIRSIDAATGKALAQFDLIYSYSAF